MMKMYIIQFFFSYNIIKKTREKKITESIKMKTSKIENKIGLNSLKYAYVHCNIVSLILIFLNHKDT